MPMKATDLRALPEMFTSVTLLLLAHDCPSPRLGDPHQRDLHPMLARAHPLWRRGRQPGAHKFDHQRDGEAMRDHLRLGRAIAGCSKQFERAAAVGLEAAHMCFVWHELLWLVLINRQ